MFIGMKVGHTLIPHNPYTVYSTYSILLARHIWQFFTIFGFWITKPWYNSFIALDKLCKLLLNQSFGAPFKCRTTSTFCFNFLHCRDRVSLDHIFLYWHPSPLPQHWTMKDSNIAHRHATEYNACASWQIQMQVHVNAVTCQHSCTHLVL